VHDELQAKLEAEYGQLPKSLKDVIVPLVWKPVLLGQG